MQVFQGGLLGNSRYAVLASEENGVVENREPEDDESVEEESTSDEESSNNEEHSKLEEQLSKTVEEFLKEVMVKEVMDEIDDAESEDI